VSTRSKPIARLAGKNANSEGWWVSCKDSRAIGWGMTPMAAYLDWKIRHWMDMIR